MEKRKTKRENPHERARKHAKEMAELLEFLELIDEFPDMPEIPAEIPFPYGARGPRPGGWRSKEWEPRNDT